jgi:hypothetical protein
MKSKNPKIQKALLSKLSRNQLTHWLLFGDNFTKTTLEELIRLCETEKTFYAVEYNDLYAYHKSKIAYISARKDWIRTIYFTSES